MLDYLKKFNSLPAELRQKVSDREAMATIETLEQKYKLPLAALIMKVMVKEIAPNDLPSFLIKENLSERAARQLAKELKEKIFIALKDYLSDGASSPTAAVRPKQQPAERLAGEITPAPPPPASILTKTLSGQAKVDELSQTAAKQYNRAKFGSQPSVKGASFFFSADDEADIRELTKKIDLTEKASLPAAAIEEKLKAILNRAQINFGSADLADRFKQILRIYLRGIRNKLGAKLTLVKPFNSGGLSFDQASAQKVMDLADKVLNSEPDQAIKPLPRIRIPEPEKSLTDRPPVNRDAPYDFSKLADAKKNLPSNVGSAGELNSGRNSKLASKESWPPKQNGPGFIKSARPTEIDHELAPLTPAIVRPLTGNIPSSGPEKKFSRSAPDNNIKPKPAAQVQGPRASQMPLIKRRFEAENLQPSQKAKIEDVKYVPRVMGPVDELKYLDLVNFRRLDKKPLTATDKIKIKIDLLAEESYARRLEGIRAWRSSPVNKLYLEIGQRSISENRPIDVIIEERKARDGDYLTAEEFKAIMDLNKSLRF